MSQTETVLLIVLGFALASLIALFVGRIAWRIAMRLGARRMQSQVPSTLKDLQADRDRLRADYAMLSQKLGSHLETVKARMAEQTAEVTRHRNRIQTLTDDVAARDAQLAAKGEEIATLATRVRELEAALAEARAAAEVEKTEAAIETSLAELDQPVPEAPAAPAAAEPPAATDDLAARLAQAEKETAALQQELARLDQTWAEKLEPEGKKASAVANVVSLARRLKPLQKGETG